MPGYIAAGMKEGSDINIREAENCCFCDVTI